MINAAENYETPLFIKGLLVIWAIYVLARVYPKIKAREPLTEEEKDLLIALGLITYFFIGSAFVKHPDLDKPTSLPGAGMSEYSLSFVVDP